MNEPIFKFELRLDWRMLRIISQLDRFDASWTSIEKKEGKSLKHLKSIATIRSVGASTRIEGSSLSDEEVQTLINNLDTSKLEDRDSQEVVGYFNVLDIISESYSAIEINENNIKSLHSELMKLSRKDEWHRGDYKKHSNVVEANFPDGTRQEIFQTTPPGYATQDEMLAMVQWYNEEAEVHPLIKIGTLIYEFLSIHPFQDGNGRLSRLLTTLLLMKNGFKWIQYVSLEHEVENRKKDYYRSLRNCQSQRPGENITEWIDFFLASLINVQGKLKAKLAISGIEAQMAPREKAIYTFIGNNPGSKSGEISEKLDIPNPTVKRILSRFVNDNLIKKHGKGAGTNYSIY